MNKKHSVFILIAVIVLISAVILGAGPVRKYIKEKDNYSENGFYMNTFVTADITGEFCKETAEAVMANIKMLDELCFSKTAEGSDVFNLNSNGKYDLSDITLNTLVAALDVCEKSGGALDIGIGALVDLWNINQGASKPPLKNDLLPLTGNKYEYISINGSEVSLDNGALIDLGAVGKGAACDSVKNIVEMSGVKRAVVSIGGSIFLYGEGGFTVGIASPEKGSSDYIATIATENGFISTSGTYERFFDYNGIRYHHILNPKTGYPVQNGLASVTIVSDSGILSDALSTACFVMGKEEGKKLAEKYGCQAVFVTDDKIIYTTDEIKKQLTVTDGSYTLAD